MATADSGKPGYPRTERAAWWAREDSNLQPSGYERANLPEKVSDYWHFRARSVTSVRVWLRRFIGYLLVESWRSEFHKKFDIDFVPGGGINHTVRKIKAVYLVIQRRPIEAKIDHHQTNGEAAN